MLAQQIKMKMPEFEQAARHEFDDLMNTSLQYMKGICPVHSGRLKDSIEITRYPMLKGSTGATFSASVGPNPEMAPYWMYPERGTGESPGKYVKAIDKRVKWGTHPGTPAQAYIERTKVFTEMMLPMTASKIIQDQQRVWNTIQVPSPT